MSESRQPMCIIPARGGSKRFPRKNLALLGGKPLLVWSIDAARASAIFDQVYVSSDDAEILTVAKQHGAIPHQRADHLAGDQTSVAEVCATISTELTEEYDPNNTIVALLPTSPFRSAATIRAAYTYFNDRNGAALLSVSTVDHPPEWAMTVRDGILQPRDAESYNAPRNQLPKTVRGDGVIMMARLEYLETHRSFLGQQTLAFASPPSETVDIDEPEDLRWAEYLMSQQEIRS
jgi:CMP-N-acetylneuraminic acid synthetase